VKPIKMSSRRLWFVCNWNITTPIPTSMQKSSKLVIAYHQVHGWVMWMVVLDIILP
jgi:hypothetical protein